MTNRSYAPRFSTVVFLCMYFGLKLDYVSTQENITSWTRRDFDSSQDHGRLIPKETATSHENKSGVNNSFVLIWSNTPFPAQGKNFSENIPEGRTLGKAHRSAVLVPFGYEQRTFYVLDNVKDLHDDPRVSKTEAVKNNRSRRRRPYLGGEEYYLQVDPENSSAKHVNRRPKRATDSGEGETGISESAQASAIGKQQDKDDDRSYSYKKTYKKTESKKTYSRLKTTHKPKYKTTYKFKHKTTHKPKYKTTHKPKYKTTHKPKYKVTHKPKKHTTTPNYEDVYTSAGEDDDDTGYGDEEQYQQCTHKDTDKLKKWCKWRGNATEPRSSSYNRISFCCDSEMFLGCVFVNLQNLMCTINEDLLTVTRFQRNGFNRLGCKETLMGDPNICDKNGAALVHEHFVFLLTIILVTVDLFVSTSG